MPKLSIISTLVDTFWLGWSRRGFILSLAVIGAIPTIVMALVMVRLVPVPPTANTPPDLAHAGAAASQAVTNSLWMVLSSLIFIVVIFLVTSMTTAALLGVLKNDPSPADLWPTIKQSIRAYTWPFIILAILLSIIACLITAPFSLLMVALLSAGIASGSKDSFSHSYVVEFIMMLMTILYLIFVKYALANPVIVLENKQPIEALKKSWRMTRGFFWYVLGCYVFLGTGEYGIDAIFQHFQLPFGFNWANAAGTLFSSVLQQYWLLVAWCMYHRIKTAEQPPAFPT